MSFSLPDVCFVHWPPGPKWKKPIVAPSAGAATPENCLWNHELQQQQQCHFATATVATDNSCLCKLCNRASGLTQVGTHLRFAVTVVGLSARNIVLCRYCRRITVDHRRQIYVEFHNQKEQNRKASKASKADLFSISSGFVEFTEDSLFSCAKAGCI